MVNQYQSEREGKEAVHIVWSVQCNFILIFIAVALYRCSDNAKLNDFDMVFVYLQELEKHDNSSSMSIDQRNQFIVEKLSKNAPSSPAMASWEAVSYAVPEDRYELFKTGAEAELKRDWDCPSMEKLAPLTGVEV